MHRESWTLEASPRSTSKQPLQKIGTYIFSLVRRCISTWLYAFICIYIWEVSSPKPEVIFGRFPLRWFQQFCSLWIGRIYKNAIHIYIYIYVVYKYLEVKSHENSHNPPKGSIAISMDFSMVSHDKKNTGIIMSSHFEEWSSSVMECKSPS